LFLAQLVEELPAIDPGVMHVIELEAYGVVAHRFDLYDADMASACDDLFLIGRVTLNLC